MPCHAMPCHAMPCHAVPCHRVTCASSGEDPTLNADYAEAFVTGMQFGPDPDRLLLSACCKQYVMLCTCLLSPISVSVSVSVSV